MHLCILTYKKYSYYLNIKFNNKQNQQKTFTIVYFFKNCKYQKYKYKN